MLRPCLFTGRNYIDADIHAEISIGGAEIGAVQRNGLTRIAGDRDANEIAAADDAVGRIELDPPRARKVDLHPGMGRAPADIAVGAVAMHEQISRDETRGDA